LSLELIPAEIHDLADGGFPVHCNFHEIETGFLGSRKRVALIDGALILPMLVDELNIAGDNSLVNARALFSGRAFYWPAYVTSPMSVDDSSGGSLPVGPRWIK
jgi:hypothetical protein